MSEPDAATAPITTAHALTKGAQVALVLAGGNALGAYQAGVYQALQAHGIEPDWVLGTSAGAINGAVIAGNAAATGFRGWPTSGVPARPAVSIPIGGTRFPKAGAERPKRWGPCSADGRACSHRRAPLWLTAAGLRPSMTLRRCRRPLRAWLTSIV